MKLQKNGDFKNNKFLIGSGAMHRGENIVDFRSGKRHFISIGDNFIFQNLKIVLRGNENSLIIGNNCRLTGHILIVGNNVNVQIGNNTTFQGVYVLAREANIVIGEGCMFSREIEIRSSDVHKIYDVYTQERVNPSEQVIIGNHVWIGARCFISKGVNIADNCIVGACSFVNKKFNESSVIIAGSPAKIVKSGIYWER